jgi:hypothetical protein
LPQRILSKFHTVSGLPLATLEKRDYDNEAFDRVMEKLLDECNRLGLLVTRDRIAEFILELVKNNRSTSSLSHDKELVRVSGTLPEPRISHHLESIHATLKSEIGAVLFRVIPRERARYCDPKWLTDSIIFLSMPILWMSFSGLVDASPMERIPLAFFISYGLQSFISLRWQIL